VITLVLRRRDGVRTEVPVRCRIDTAEELSIHQAGGVLQRFAHDFLAAATPPTLQATT
jgi:aconitate hydratase